VVKSALSFCLVKAFRHFGDMPRERIMVSQYRHWGEACVETCHSFNAKQGGGLFRVVSLVELLLLFLLLQATYLGGPPLAYEFDFLHLFLGGVSSPHTFETRHLYCRGSLRKTHLCMVDNSKCALYRVLNCKYYYTHTVFDMLEGQAAAAQGASVGSAQLAQLGYIEPESLVDPAECYDPEVFKPFSGAADVRLISSSVCIRNAVLSMDVRRSTSVYDFRLLDKTLFDEGYYDGLGVDWYCAPGAKFCFWSVDMAVLACLCPYDLVGVVRLDILNIWLSACTAVDLIDVSAGAAAADAATADAGRRRNLPAAAEEDQRDPHSRKSAKKASGELLREDAASKSGEKTSLSYLPGRRTAGPRRSLFAVQEVEQNVKTLLTQQCNEPFQETKKCEQECSWGSDAVEGYFFAEADCDLAVDDVSWLFHWSLWLGAWMLGLFVLWNGFVNLVFLASQGDVEPWAHNPADGLGWIRPGAQASWAAKFVLRPLVMLLGP